MAIDATQLAPEGRLNGQILRRLRRARHLRQEDVAVAVGTSRSFVARLEASPASPPKGRQPSLRLLSALADLFGVDATDLLLDEESARAA